MPVPAGSVATAGMMLGVSVAAAVLALAQTSSAERCPPPSPRSVEMLFAPCVAAATYRRAVPDEQGLREAPIVPAPGLKPRAPAPSDDPAVARKSPVDDRATGSIRP